MSSTIRVYNHTSIRINVGSSYNVYSGGYTDCTYIEGYTIRIKGYGDDNVRLKANGGVSLESVHIYDDVTWPTSGTIHVYQYSQFLYSPQAHITATWPYNYFIRSDQTYQLTANDYTDFEFSHWSGSSTSTDRTISGTIGYIDYSFFANYNQLYYYYTLSFSANGGTDAPGTLSAKTSLSFHIFTIPDDIPTREDYEFKGWSYDGGATTGDYQPGNVVTLNESTGRNKTLYAIWSLDVEGITVVNGTNVTISVGSGYTIPRQSILTCYYIPGSTIRISADVPITNTGDTYRDVTWPESGSIGVIQYAKLTYAGTQGGTVKCLYPSGTYVVANTQKITLTAQSNDGYEFEKWSDESTDNPLSFKMGWDDVSYTAYFKHYVEVVFTDTETPAPEVTHKYYESNFPLTLTPVEKEGYEATGFNINSFYLHSGFTMEWEDVKDLTTDTITVSIIYHKIVPEYTIKFTFAQPGMGYILYGGKQVTEITADEGTKLTLQIYLNEEYMDKWAIWYYQVGGVYTYDTSTIYAEFDESKTYVIWFRQVKFDIKVVMNTTGAGLVGIYDGADLVSSGTTASYTFDRNDKVKIRYFNSDTEKWILVGWLFNDGSTIKSTDNPYTFLASTSTEGTYTTSIIEHTGDTNTLEGIPKLQTTSGEVTDYNAGTFNMKSYDYDTLLNEEDDVYGMEVPYDKTKLEPYRYSYSIEAVPKTGYSFVQWNDGSTTNPRTGTSSIYYSEGIKYTAIFSTSIYYTVSCKIVGYGKVSGTGPYVPGTDVVVQAIPDGGSKFLHWEDGSTDPTRTITNIQQDYNLTATFETTNLNLLFVAMAILGKGGYETARIYLGSKYHIYLPKIKKKV